MMACLPADKLQRIRSLLATWLRKRKATKRKILSLVSLLQHATKVVKPGRTFVARMYSEAVRLCRLSFFIRLSKDLRSDLRWWHLFVHAWNAVSFLECSPTPRPPDIYIETCFWFLGLWGSVQQSLVSVAVVYRMEANGYYDKGISSYHLTLYRLGPPTPQKNTGIQVR